jgi:hypothetical protein
MSLMVLLLMLSSLTWVPGAAQAQAAPVRPTFSHVRGFYPNPSAPNAGGFNLTLSAPAGTIYYTTNGDSPVRISDNSIAPSATQYTGPIAITTTTVVRAVTVSGAQKSPVMTHSYIFLGAVRNQNYAGAVARGWPSQYFAAEDPKVGTFPVDYDMDPEVLNHTNNSAPGKFEAVMKALPTLSIVTDLDNLWNPNYGIFYNPNAKEGHEDYPAGDPFTNPVSPGKWERPLSVEWINPDGSTGFQQDGGIRMHGQASRRPKRTPKKTFRLYFKRGYSPDVGGNLEFQLFSDASAVSKFDRLVLRMGGNRSWPYFDKDQRRETDYVNDEWARQAWEEMGHVTSHGTYVHLYINGLYWGLYNVAERIDEKFLASYHPGLTENDFDLIESEEEQDDNSVASVGDMTAYNTVMGIINPGSDTPITDQQYNQLKTLIDMENMADYFIHVHYIGKTDWPDHNYNMYRARIGPDTRFKFLAWDNDSGLNKVNQNTTLMTETLTYPYIMGPEGEMVPDTSKPLMYDAPVQIFYRLTSNAEFRQLVTDRFYKHVVDPTGTLAPARCAQIYTELTNIVDQPVIAESARWGDYSRDVYPPTNFIDLNDKPFPAYLYSRDLPTAFTDPTNAVPDDVQKTWEQVRAEKLNTYCPNRSNIALSQYQANGWYQAPLNVPGISQRGGTVPTANPTVTLNNTTNNGLGEIYYTTNGADPRQEYGALNTAGGATLAAGAGGDSATITISRATTVKARVRNGNSWSPLLEYTFAPTQALANLVINEVHYAPSVPLGLDAKQYEFIELYNKGTQPLQLDRVRFSRGITFQFPANIDILPGQYIVLASNPSAFQSRYGFAPFGTFTGSLANEGEPVELLDAIGTSFERVDYKPVAPWPSLLAPNAGKSLSLTSPALDNSLFGSWQVSNAVNGTPGGPNGHTQQGPQTPSILWTTPSAITYGIPLTVAQLNATISGPPGSTNGVFTYNPPLGTVLQAGYGQTLSVTFTPNDTTNYATATASVKLDVLRAPLTATADPQIWQVGLPMPALTVSYSGFVNGDTAEGLDTPPEVTTEANETSPEGTYPLIVSGGADNNYELNYVHSTLTVSNKTIPTLIWTSPEGLTYGAGLGAAQLNAVATSGGLPVPGTFTYNPPLGTVLTAGGHTLNATFTPNDTNTYVAVSKNVTINISKAPLIIRANDKYKQVGTPNPVLTASYFGLVNNDTSASLDVQPVLSTTATQASSVGVYPITVAGAADANYTIEYIAGELTIGTEAAMLKLMLPMVVGR